MNEGQTYVPAEYPPPRADTRVPRADGKQKRADRVETSRRAEFQQIDEHGVRISGRHATIFLLPNTREVGRLGIAATKKLGGAVQRNRAKRLIREVFRRNNIAPGFDVVVVPKRDLLDASLTVLEAEYRTNLERRLRARRPNSA
jgi:ribonuclease P protein component